MLVHGHLCSCLSGRAEVAPDTHHTGLALLPLLTHWFESSITYTPAYPPFHIQHPPSDLPMHFEPKIPGVGYCHHENAIVTLVAPIVVDTSVFTTIIIEAQGRGWMRIEVADDSTPSEQPSSVIIEPHFHISERELESNLNVQLKTMVPNYQVLLHTPVHNEASSDCYATNIKVTLPRSWMSQDSKHRLIFNIPQIHIDADFDGLGMLFESVHVLSYSMNMFVSVVFGIWMH